MKVDAIRKDKYKTSQKNKNKTKQIKLANLPSSSPSAESCTELGFPVNVYTAKQDVSYHQF